MHLIDWNQLQVNS